MLLDWLKNFVNSCGSLLLLIVYEATFRNTMKTAHNSCLDQTDRAINIMVLDAWDQNLFSLLKQVFLDCTNMLNVTDVFIKAWVYSHMLCTNSESLAVLVLILYKKNKRNTSWISTHHILHKIHRQMNTFDNKWLVTLVKHIYNFSEFFCDESALLFVSLERNPVFARIMSLFLRNCISCFISWAE